MIAPGSRSGINHPFSWYAIVKEKATGKLCTYWMNGNHLNREGVAEEIRIHFPYVTPITIDTCKTQPTKLLVPVPREHFQCGALKQAMGIENEKPGKLKPISLKPLSLRRPLWR